MTSKETIKAICRVLSASEQRAEDETDGAFVWAGESIRALSPGDTRDELRKWHARVENVLRMKRVVRDGSVKSSR